LIIINYKNTNFGFFVTRLSQNTRQAFFEYLPNPHSQKYLDNMANTAKFDKFGKFMENKLDHLEHAKYVFCT